MASVTFRVHYTTEWGESLLLERLTPPEPPAQGSAHLCQMQHETGGFWSLTLDDAAPGSTLEYRYVFLDREARTRREPAYRRLDITSRRQLVWDHWLAPESAEGAFLRQAFAGVIFNPTRTTRPTLSPETRLLHLTLRAPRVAAGHQVCVSGAHHLLGHWDPSKARLMSGARYPVWELDLPAAEFSEPTEFKFGLWDEQQARLVQFEEGENRVFHGSPPDAEVLVVNFEHYRHPAVWRGAGVAIPVFSLRTESSFGVGEFADLALFALWAARCNLQVIQLLPVNDTSSDFTWKDSYPYKAISTDALHPIYLKLDRVFADCHQPLPQGYRERRTALNRLPHLDYEAVLKEKLDYLHPLFAQVRQGALVDPEFQRYVKEQAAWLSPYAGFCHLRDLHSTADFTQWGDAATYRPERINAWFNPAAPEYDAVMFHCWMQFHLARQLADAVVAGHACGVAFKGDLPIGIDRGSVEAWTQPELFQMDRQTGAPPDAFAVLGQNWGFPTYNWARMEASGYEWWKRRFRRMSTVFDALRIDHILGFFRIWEIPICYQEGILGHYHPARPLSREEIARAGFTRDPRQFARGTVPAGLLPEYFESATATIAEALLDRDAGGFCRLRAEFTSPKARRAWAEKNLSRVETLQLEDGMRRLSFEVLFLEDPDQPDHFHPRINLADSAVFRALPSSEQAALRQLHDDFFFRRHTGFWADEALKKLPVLMDASQMLICGEDLGMVPDSVPIVLKQLGLLSLEVQRWPKQAGQRFGNPAEYPYLSVCTTSTHDMSTIRGWWEEEPKTRQHFWSEIMRRPGEPVPECSPEICRFIVSQNLSAASMWCILPLQDWLGTDAGLRHPVAAEERINVPANPRHYWRYRMHLTIETLLKAEPFNQSITELLRSSGRGPGD